jgi:hypothetical protein
MGETVSIGCETSISVIVPAYNEGQLIEETLRAIRRGRCLQWFAPLEIIVVDDGSTDETFTRAACWADAVIRHPFPYGKGMALHTGCKIARGSILVFLDADLGVTAECFPSLVAPLIAGNADMVIAQLPPARKRGGFGMVKKLAKQGVYRLSGFEPSAPMSGQRAVQRTVMERIGRLADGFGVEVGLTIDAVRLGYRVQEQEIAFSHRESGRDIQSWLHRGKQFCAVSGTLWHRWRQPIC